MPGYRTSPAPGTPRTGSCRKPQRFRRDAEPSPRCRARRTALPLGSGAIAGNSSASTAVLPRVGFSRASQHWTPRDREFVSSFLNAVSWHGAVRRPPKTS